VRALRDALTGSKMLVEKTWLVELGEIMEYDYSDTLWGAAGAATILLVFAVLTIFPFFRIFQRTGRSGWWAILMFIPILNIIVLWVFAFARWPALSKNTN
jgi:hypothetical protein